MPHVQLQEALPRGLWHLCWEVGLVPTGWPNRCRWVSPIAFGRTGPIWPRGRRAHDWKIGAHRTRMPSLWSSGPGAGVFLCVCVCVCALRPIMRQMLLSPRRVEVITEPLRRADMVRPPPNRYEERTPYSPSGLAGPTTSGRRCARCGALERRFVLS